MYNCTTPFDRKRKYRFSFSSIARTCKATNLMPQHSLLSILAIKQETMIRSALRSSKTLSHLGSRQNGSIRLMSGKEIKFGVEGRAAMLKGVDTLADAVQVRE